MKKLGLVLVLMASFVLSACGKSEQEKKADEAQKIREKILQERRESNDRLGK